MDCGNLEGQTLDQRYQIRNRVGHGGMGTVYRAFDSNFKTERALKVMASNYAYTTEFQRRFEVEARTANQLSHPGLIRVFDYNPAPPCPYLVMELIDGPNLAKYMAARPGLMPLTEAVEILRQVSLAVAYLHQQDPPIFHRDIKPSNILLKRASGSQLRYQPVLTDFGLVKLASHSDLTEVGRSYGTPGYMSPEQAEDSATVDHRSDIFSLGVLLYHLVTGQLPFDRNRAGEGPPPSPADLRPGLPDSIQAIILKAMAFDPNKRYPTAQALAADLQATLPQATEVDIQKGPKIEKAVAGSETEVASGIAAPPSVALPPASIVASDRIRVIPLDGDPYSHPLTQNGLTIGRGPHNNLVLNFPKVSWQHARIDYVRPNYTIIDLDSRNRTYLDSVHLLPGQGQIWRPGQWVMIGGCSLLLERDKVSEVDDTSAPQQEIPPSDTSSRPLIPFTATFDRKEVEVVPSKQETISLILANNRRVADQFDLNFEMSYGNKPVDVEKWLGATRMTVMVRANDSEKIHLPIKSPAGAKMGIYQIVVNVTTASDPDSARPDDICRLKLKRETQFISRMTEDEQNQTWHLFIENQGNARETFRLSWSPTDELYFKDARSRISVTGTSVHLESPPNEAEKRKRPGIKRHQKEIAFKVARRRRHWFGFEEPFKFQVEVKPEHGEARRHQGEFISKPMSIWRPILVSIVILLIGLGVIGWVLTSPRVQIIEISPEIPVVGESVTVRWTASGLIRQLMLTERTTLPSEPSGETVTLPDQTEETPETPEQIKETLVSPELTEYTYPTGLLTSTGPTTITLEGLGYLSPPARLRLPSVRLPSFIRRNPLPKSVDTPDFLLQKDVSTWVLFVVQPTPAPVAAPPIIEEFTVTPAQAAPGQTVTLKWQVTNADKVQIDVFGDVPPVGEQTDVPQQTTRYTLTASNQAAGSVNKVITVLIGTATPPTPTTPEANAPGGAGGSGSGGGSGGGGGSDGAAGGGDSGGGEDSTDEEEAAPEDEIINPIAEDDAATTTQDTSVSINVLANDSDPAGGNLTITSIVESGQTNGRVVFSGAETLLYTPSPGFTGSSQFSYLVTNEEGGQSSARVTVTVSPAP